MRPGSAHPLAGRAPRGAARLAVLLLAALALRLPGAAAQTDMDEYQEGSVWGGYGRDGHHSSRSGFVPGQESSISLAWDYKTEGRLFSCAVNAADDFLCGSNGNLYKFSAFDGDISELVWKSDIGSSQNGYGVQGVPVLDERGNGTVYVGDLNKDELLNDNSAMHAYAMDTGEELWAYPASHDEDSTYFGQVVTSPVLGNDGRLYFGTAEGSGTVGGSNALWALDAADGSLQWSFALPQGVSASPAYANGTIYLMTGGVLYSLGDAGDNVTVHWTTRLADAASVAELDSPPAVSDDGAAVYVGAGSSMFRVDAASGEVDWEFATADLISSGAAVSQTGDIVFGSYDNSVYRLTSGRTLRWEFVTDGQVRGTPVFLGDDSVLVGSFDGYLYRLDDGGSQMYRYQLEVTENTFTSALSITRTGHVLFGTSDNYVRAVGGDGGCAKGKYTNLDVQAGEDLCLDCPSGQVTTQVNLDTCTECAYGSWSGDEGSTFCYLCVESKWCPGGNLCDDGRDGVACSACASGYFTLSDRCEVCPDNSWLLFAAVVLIVGFILFLLFRASGASAYTTGTKFSHEVAPMDQIMFRVDLGSRSRDETFEVKAVHHDYMITLTKPLPDKVKVTKIRFKYKKRRKRGKGKWRTGTGLISAQGDKVKGRVTSGTQILATALVIGVGYMQLVAMFIQFDLSWPPMVKDVLDYLGSIVNFSIPDLMASPECEFDATYFTKWGLSVTMPLVLLSIFLMWFMLAGVRYQNPVTRRRSQDRCIQVALICVTILYVYATAETVEPLDCTTQPDGSVTLDASPDIECSLDNNQYFFIISSSMLLFCLYGFGLPLWLFRTLSRAKKANKFGDVTFVQRYGWLFLRYNKSLFFWEIIIMARKLIIVIIAAFNSANPKAQANWTIVVLSIALVAHLHYKPFVCYECLKQRKKRCQHLAANDKLEGGVLAGSILVLSFGLESFDGANSDIMGGLILAVLTMTMMLLGKVLWDAYKNQKVERKRLQQEGLADTTDQDVRKIQMILSI